MQLQKIKQFFEVTRQCTLINRKWKSISTFAFSPKGCFYCFVPPIVTSSRSFRRSVFALFSSKSQPLVVVPQLLHKRPLAEKYNSNYLTEKSLLPWVCSYTLRYTDRLVFTYLNRFIINSHKCLSVSR